MTISQATTASTSGAISSSRDSRRTLSASARRSQRRLLTDPITVKLTLPASEVLISVPQPEPAWFYPVLDRLQHLSRLAYNWDSYGGHPPSDESVLTTLVVLSHVLRAESRAPAIVPLSEGGTQVEWHGDGHELEIRVASDGVISAFRFDEQAGRAYEVDDVRLSDLSRVLALSGQR